MAKRGPFKKIVTGIKAVTTAGTQVQLTATALSMMQVTIRALSTNGGLIYVGNSTVSSSDGFQLSAKEEISLELEDLTIVWIDSAVNGEGVSFIALRD